MALDFKNAFPQSAPSAAGTTNKSDRPTAQFWLNVGYDSGVVDPETGESKFISLPLGIPVDTQEHLKANGKNREFAQFQAARNDLLDQIMAHANQLEPGESKLVNLQIQLRRVSEQAEDVGTDNNAFARKLDL